MFRSILIEHFLIGAYPRSRGENRAEKAHPAFQKGSSPLTRGKQAASRGCCVAARLIPLTRGKQNAAPTGHVLKGLIPSHTGKTWRRTPRSSTSSAHPRSRGENFEWFAQGKWWTGSSPITQGKRRIILPTGRPVRLIPAHAGKTKSSRPPLLLNYGFIPTHAGKTRPMIAMCAVLLGSSPHTRGKHQGERRGLLRLGLIPAHAGKTRSRRPSTR